MARKIEISGRYLLQVTAAGICYAGSFTIMILWILYITDIVARITEYINILHDPMIIGLVGVIPCFISIIAFASSLCLAFKGSLILSEEVKDDKYSLLCSLHNSTSSDLNH